MLLHLPVQEMILQGVISQLMAAGSPSLQPPALAGGCEASWALGPAGSSWGLLSEKHRALHCLSCSSTSDINPLLLVFRSGRYLE